MTLTSIVVSVFMPVGIETSGCFENEFQKNRK